jgi:hypothetical protein
VDLADALRDAGGVVAGGSALGAGVAWIVAVLLGDLGLRADVTRWVQWGGGLGATAALAILLSRAIEVR